MLQTGQLIYSQHDFCLLLQTQMVYYKVAATTGEKYIKQITLKFDEILLVMGVENRKQFPVKLRRELL